MDIMKTSTGTVTTYTVTHPVNRYRTAAVMIDDRTNTLHGLIYRVRAFLANVEYKTIEVHLAMNALQIHDKVPGLIATNSIRSNSVVVEGAIHVTMDVSKLGFKDRVKLVEVLLSPDLFTYSPPMQEALQGGVVSTTHFLPDSTSGLDPTTKRKRKS